MSIARSHITALSRRAFLRTAAALGAWLGGTASLAGCAPAGKDHVKPADSGTDSGGPDTGACVDPTPLALNAGNAADYPVGTLAGVSGQPVCVGRDSSGVYAMSTICTHQQCDMQQDGHVNNNGLLCSCHGSKFDANGAVTRGPATQDLDHYEVAVACDGTITVNKRSTVSADVRTAVP